jgi:hypothetical protein
MRIWSLHPKYLDTKGLVALWRETLLAKHVLENKTKGYRNHPQLTRFKNCSHPLHAINYYLSVVHEEAEERGHQFDKNKIDWEFEQCKIPVNSGQVEYEIQHLKNKLEQRDILKLERLSVAKNVQVHPLFKKINGGVEDWEIVS